MTATFGTGLFRLIRKALDLLKPIAALFTFVLVKRHGTPFPVRLFDSRVAGKGASIRQFSFAALARACELMYPAIS
jgi:hypothetical protein